MCMSVGAGLALTPPEQRNRKINRKSEYIRKFPTIQLRQQRITPLDHVLLLFTHRGIVSSLDVEPQVSLIQTLGLHVMGTTVSQHQCVHLDKGGLVPQNQRAQLDMALAQ